MDKAAQQRARSGEELPRREPLSLALFVLLVAFLAICLVFALLVIDRARHPVLFASVLVVASIPWFLLTWLVAARNRTLWVGWVLVAGLALRVLAQMASPALSTDLFRYVWEGRLQLEGVNPYLTAPEDPSVRDEENEIWKRLDHKEVPAAYPPVCQLYLRLLASFGEDPLVFRGGFAALDLLLMFLVMFWLVRIGVDPALTLVYALCPLVVVELGVEGHNDSLGLALLISSLAVLGRENGTWKRAAFGGFLLGAAIAAKFLPAVLLPWLVRRDWRILPTCVLAVVLGYLPYLHGVESLGDLFAGLDHFATRWRHNDSLFFVIYEATGWAQMQLRQIGLEGWLTNPHELQKVAKLPLYTLLLIGASWMFIIEKDAARVMVPLLAMFYALAPTLHPWYIVWAVPFLAVRPSLALFSLVAGVPFSYHVITQNWEESTIFKWIEFLPFYSLMILDFRRIIRRKR